MRKTFTLLLITCIVYTVKAQEPNFEWGKQVGGSGYTGGHTILTDSNEDMYIIGNFSGTTDFNPNSETENLTAIGSRDVFIQKLNSEGNLLWVKQIGGADSFVLSQTALTDANGDIYITGYFEDTIDFDPNSGVENFTSIDRGDSYILKLDSDANFLWVKKMGGIGYQSGIHMVVDSSNNLYTFGNFEGTVDFNPNSGIQYFTSNGWLDVFIQKLDTNGNFVWAKQIAGNTRKEAKSLAIDSNDNIYATGFFEGAIDFNPNAQTHILNSVGNEDAYILKLDQNGNFQWVKQIGGNNMDRGMAILIDNENNIYTSGHFEDTVDFDPNAGIQNLTSFGLFDIFVQKLNSDGDYIWAKQFGGTGYEMGRDLATDVNNNIYITGSFSETADFDPSNNHQYFTCAGDVDAFILKLNSNGNHLWAKQIGGTEFDTGTFITTIPNGGILTLGSFSGTIDIDTSTEVQNLTASGVSDFYILKLSDNALSINENIVDNIFKVFPNPTNEKITLAFKSVLKNVEIEIFDTLGRSLSTAEYQNTNLIDLKINDTSGMYVILIKTPEFEKRISIIKN